MEKRPRILSLIPSATEIVAHLGLADQLVGVSHECDYPKEVKDLPALTAPKLDPTGTSQAIDNEVRELIQKGVSVYEIDLEKLQQLKPDVIITQDQCAVCAVSLSQVERAVSQLSGQEVRICSLNPNCLNDIYEDIHRVGQACEQEAKARQLVEEMKASLAKIQAANPPNPPRVICLEWLDPPMIAGGWIPELVTIAGGHPLIVEGPKKFETVDWQTIVNANPDKVVLLPCGFKLPQTQKELRENETLRAQLRKLSACQQGKLYSCDGNAYFNRPGPRIVESTLILAEIFRGNLGAAPHSELSKAWTQLDDFCVK